MEQNYKEENYQKETVIAFIILGITVSFCYVTEFEHKITIKKGKIEWKRKCYCDSIKK